MKTLLLIAALLLPSIAFAATPALTVPQGGTGSSTLSGILIGNGLGPVRTLIIGSNLTLVGTTLSATGAASSFSYPFPSNATSTSIAFNGGLTGVLTGSVVGNSSTATALAANGTNCSAGNYPLGIDASGNVESCTAAGGGLSFSYPFPSNATSTSIAFNGGLTGVLTGSVVGNSSTATALAANGTNAAAGNAILGVDASGNAEGAFDVWTQAENTAAAYIAGVTADSPLSGSGTAASHLTISTAGTWSGNAGTATALAANGTNCSAGNYPLGVDASGNVESCTAAGGGTVTGTTGQGVYMSGTNTAVGTSSIFLSPAGNFGVGSTSPFARLSVHGNNGDTNTTLFAIGSSTASATTTLFSINNTGSIYMPGTVRLTNATGPLVAGGTSVMIGLNAGINQPYTANTAIVAIGSGAGQSNSGQFSHFVAIGDSALLGSVGNNNSVAVGYSAATQTLGVNNVAIGYSALNGTFGNSANFNVAIGESALVGITSSGNGNTALGYQAGSAVTTGFGNTLIGASNTANNLTTGGGNIGIGQNIFFPSGTTNNQLNLGGILFGTLPATSTAFALPTTGAIGIGTTSPVAKFSIHANNGDTVPLLFAIGSSTANATSTLFSISNTGALTTTGAGLTAVGTPLQYNISNTTAGAFSGVVVQTVLYANSGSTGPRINSNGMFMFTSGSAVSSNPDTGIARQAAGIFEFNKGTAVGTAGVPSNLAKLIAGSLGLGTTTPYANLSIHANNGDTNKVLFTIASSTALATTTLFLVDNAGNVGIGSTTPFSALTVGTGAATSSITVAEYKYGKSGNAATSTAANIDCNASNQVAWPIGFSATTLTLINVTPGKKCIVVVQNPAGTAGAITWAVQSGAILKWAGGTTPTQTTTANAMDIWSFLTTSGSTTMQIIGAATLNN